MFYCNLFKRSNQKLYWNLGSLNKIDSIDIDYQNYEMHDIDCLNDHNLYGPSMVNHEKSCTQSEWSPNYDATR